MASSEDDGGSVWGKVGLILLGLGAGFGVGYGINRTREQRPAPLPTPPRPLADGWPTPRREVLVDDPPELDEDLEVEPAPKRKPKPKSTPAPKRRARAPRGGPVFIPEPVEPELGGEQPVVVEPWMTDWSKELAQKIREADRKYKT